MKGIKLNNRLAILTFVLACFFCKGFCSANNLQYPFNQPMIIVVKGACSSGKSTLIQSLKKRLINFDFVDEDSILYEKYSEAIDKKFPYDFSKIKKAIDNKNIYPAIRYDKSIFKESATQHECEEAKTSLVIIQKRLKDQENLHWEENVNANISRKVITEIQSALAQNLNIIVDSWSITENEIESMFPKANIIRALVYCPFPVVHQRFLKRNREAITQGDLQQVRSNRQLMNYFSLYKITCRQEKAIQSVDMDKLNKTLEAISCGLEEKKNFDLKPGFAFDEISRAEFEAICSEHIKAVEDYSNKTYYTAPYKQYDAIIDITSGDLQEAINCFILTISQKKGGGVKIGD